MLTLLKIQNLALVDHLMWEPQSGFLSITGETGAGKSVIIGGIALALGVRADKSLIRTGEQQCVIEVCFQLQTPEQTNNILEEQGIPSCEDGLLVIRRIITQTTNRQFINGSAATLSLLRELGANLVDLHSPEDHHSLTSTDRQRSLLDAYAENTKERNNYHRCWKSWTQAKRQYEALLHSEQANERELAFLHHQLEEITTAAFTEEELNDLHERWQRARNSSKLSSLATQLASAIDTGGEQSLSQSLHALIKGSHELQRLDSSTQTWASTLDPLALELDEFSQQLQRYLNLLDADPEAYERLSERINLWENLKCKYGNSLEEIQEHTANLQQRLDNIENRSEHLAQLQTHCENAQAALTEAAKKLSTTRQSAAPRLAKDILHHTHDLGFKQARFDIDLKHSSELGAYGAESVEFLFGPNSGEPSKPLRLIGSGGELARVMLAIKSALAQQDATPLLIFDEIDANVGGEIARSVGIKMRELGAQHQIISITHFPQVAALAKHHYLIQKSLVQERTISSLNEVTGEARLEELVRMLGGGSQTARAHAQELLSF